MRRRWWFQARLLVGRIRACVAACRRELDRSVTPPPVERGVTRLVRLLRDEVLVAVTEQRLRHRRDLVLADGLRPYFGSYPKSLLDRSAAEGAGFEAEMRRLGEAFLGRRAAAAVLDRSKPDLGMAWTRGER